MNENLKINLLTALDKYKLPVLVSLAGLVLIAGGLIFNGSNRQNKQFPKESIIEADKFVLVDVSGAVAIPGVYKIKEGSRVEDAIKAAGGVSKESNSEFIQKNINQAAKLTDGSKVYVPYAGENSGGNYQSVSGVSSLVSKVNINTASQSELEALPGVGPVTASKIISLRPYSSTDELLGRKAVSKAVYEKIKDRLSLY